MQKPYVRLGSPRGAGATAPALAGPGAPHQGGGFAGRPGRGGPQAEDGGDDPETWLGSIISIMPKQYGFVLKWCTPKPNGFADHYPVFKWL